LTCGNIFEQLSNKVVGLDLAPHIEIVENHVVEARKTLTATTSYFLVRTIKPGL